MIAQQVSPDTEPGAYVHARHLVGSVEGNILRSDSIPRLRRGVLDTPHLRPALGVAQQVAIVFHEVGSVGAVAQEIAIVLLEFMNQHMRHAEHKGAVGAG